MNSSHYRAGSTYGLKQKIMGGFKSELDTSFKKITFFKFYHQGQGKHREKLYTYSHQH